jgi:hypothetical protein
MRVSEDRLLLRLLLLRGKHASMAIKLISESKDFWGSLDKHSPRSIRTLLGVEGRPPLRGERSDCEAIRVRGQRRNSEPCGRRNG